MASLHPPDLPDLKTEVLKPKKTTLEQVIESGILGIAKYMGSEVRMLLNRPDIVIDCKIDTKTTEIMITVRDQAGNILFSKP